MLDYSQLDALVAILSEKSFDGAARSLGLTPSAISQRIRKLEERIGAIVVKRVVPPTPTAVGSMLCRHAEIVRALEREIVSNPGWIGQAGEADAVKIKIAVDETNLCSWFIDALAQESKSRPETLFEIVIPDSPLVNTAMKSGTALAALSFEKEPVHGFKSIFLGSLVFRATASPAFLERYFPDGVSREALELAPALRHHSQDDLQRRWIKRVLGTTIRLQEHTIPSSYGRVTACRHGLAWGINPASLVNELLRDGELAELVDGVIVKTDLYWHYSLLISNTITPLTRSVRLVAQHHLDQGNRPAAPTCFDMPAVVVSSSDVAIPFQAKHIPFQAKQRNGGP